MYPLCLWSYLSVQAVKSGFDAIRHTISVTSKFHEATSYLLAGSAYRLHRRVFFRALTIGLSYLQRVHSFPYQTISSSLPSEGSDKIVLPLLETLIFQDSFFFNCMEQLLTNATPLLVFELSHQVETLSA